MGIGLVPATVACKQKPITGSGAEPPIGSKRRVTKSLTAQFSTVKAILCFSVSGSSVDVAIVTGE